LTYEITDIDALGRIGKLNINNKQMITPNLFPVVHPLKNLINASHLEKIGAQCLFTNSYIIYQNKNLKEIVLKEKLHHYLNFNGIIATDSGAFQQYIYNHHHQFKIDAEDIEHFQENIGSDFAVILDVPVQPTDDYEMAKSKVSETIVRAKENIKRRNNDNCHWFGPIHGSKYSDLLKNCSIEMSKLNFDIYAIGGLVKLFLNYQFDLTINILLTVKRYIVPNKPIHMFGLGLPQFFSLAVACGCDLMDSAAYILYAKENRYFTLSTGTKKLEELVEFPCHCPVCSQYTPKELKSFEDKLRIELLAKHNLYLSFSELRTIRQAIREGNLWELVEQRIRSHPSLVRASQIIKDNWSLIESNEKIYKNHGRFFGSPESLNRPIIKRYEKRIKNNYRPPFEAKYLIILPILLFKNEPPPNINTWIELINENKVIDRNYIHITLFSEYFGIIPLELSNTFPMGQYESMGSLDQYQFLYENALEKLRVFFNSHLDHYRVSIMLIPEICSQSYKKSIKNVFMTLKSKFNYEIVITNSLEKTFKILQNYKN